MPSVQAPQSPVVQPAHTERTSLLHWHQHEADQTVATAAQPQKQDFFHRILPFTHVSSAAPAAQAQAGHWYNFATRKAAPEQHVYKTGVADAIRLNGLLLSVQADLGLAFSAMFLDFINPSRPSPINPRGERNELAAFTCLLAAWIALGSVGPAIAGHLQGTMVYGCSAVGNKMHAHPITTRMAGYVTSMTLATGGLVGAVVLGRHISHANSQTPEMGYGPTIYQKAGVLELVASIPGLAVVGWYAGRILSSAVRRAP